MPVRITPVPVPDLPFIHHCLTYWNDTVVCSDAHVAVMKRIVCRVFGLPGHTPLFGILFEDGVLAMLCSPNYRTFYVLDRLDGLRASVVITDGFTVHWGMTAGFYDGICMAEGALVGVESAGPTEE